MEAGRSARNVKKSENTKNRRVGKERGDEKAKTSTEKENKSAESRREQRGGGIIKLFYTNAQSICNKMNILKSNILESKPHIIAITESWLDDSFNAGEIFPSDYCVFRNDRNTHGVFP